MSRRVATLAAQNAREKEPRRRCLPQENPAKAQELQARKSARELLMFGMLDYRAYKLFWLIGLPFRLALRLAFFVILAIAIFIRIERLLAKVEAELARTARPRRDCFDFDEEAEAKAQGLP
jgi:hypothetical protein